MANIKEARTCANCKGSGRTPFGDECHPCKGFGSVVTDLAPSPPEVDTPTEYVRKVITPAADEFDFIAKRLKELEAEKAQQGEGGVTIQDIVTPEVDLRSEQEDPFIYPDFY